VQGGRPRKGGSKRPTAAKLSADMVARCDTALVSSLCSDQCMA
jgi:hypothetical protein